MSRPAPKHRPRAGGGARSRPGRRSGSRPRGSSTTSAADESEAVASEDNAQGERLQKVMASAGVGSRRECETLITDGRVEVDRQVVTELGVRVDPDRQRIRVDGVALTRPTRVYYLLNKPPGVVCTNRDPDGRIRVVDLIRSDQRLFSIGRLDRTSEGMIICTNDGNLAYRLTHPKFGVEKRYWVRVAGRAEWEKLAVLREGVRLSDGLAKVSDIKIRRRYRSHTELEIVLDEGRNREIRRLLAKLGHKVVTLRRVAIGPLRLGDLPVGAHRQLSPREVRQLKQLAARSPATRRRDRPAARRGAAAGRRAGGSDLPTGAGRRSAASDRTRSKRWKASSASNKPRKKGAKGGR